MRDVVYPEFNEETILSPEALSDLSKIKRKLPEELGCTLLSDSYEGSESLVNQARRPLCTKSLYQGLLSPITSSQLWNNQIYPTATRT